MKNEVDEFLEGLDNQPKDDPFKPESEDPFAQPIVEEQKTEEVKEDRPLPFHKDPKVQKFIKKEVEKRIGVKAPEPEKVVKSEDAEDVVSAFQTIIGNDTPEKVHALKMLGKTIHDVEEKASQKALEHINAREQAERDAETQARQQLENGFEGIEEEFGVDITSNTAQAKKTKSDFVDFLTRISPKDGNGEVKEFADFNESFRLFKDSKKSEAPSNAKAKELASRGMQRSTDASVIPQSTDQSWNGVEKVFSKL